MTLCPASPPPAFVRDACLRVPPRAPLCADVTVRMPADFYVDGEGFTRTGPELAARIMARARGVSLRPPLAPIGAVIAAQQGGA